MSKIRSRIAVPMTMQPTPPCIQTNSRKSNKLYKLAEEHIIKLTFLAYLLVYPQCITK